MVHILADASATGCGMSKLHLPFWDAHGGDVSPRRWPPGVCLASSSSTFNAQLLLFLCSSCTLTAYVVANGRHLPHRAFATTPPNGQVSTFNKQATAANKVFAWSPSFVPGSRFSRFFPAARIRIWRGHTGTGTDFQRRADGLHASYGFWNGAPSASLLQDSSSPPSPSLIYHEVDESDLREL